MSISSRKNKHPNTRTEFSSELRHSLRDWASAKNTSFLDNIIWWFLQVSNIIFLELQSYYDDSFGSQEFHFF